MVEVALLIASVGALFAGWGVFSWGVAQTSRSDPQDTEARG